jgi:hypothetical protein
VLNVAGDIDSVALRLSQASAEKSLVGDLSALAESIKSYSWTDLEAIRGDPAALEKVEEAAELLRALSRSLGRENK